MELKPYWQEVDFHTSNFFIKIIILFLVIYLIVKNFKFIFVVLALIFLFFALQTDFGYDATAILTQVFSYN